MSIDFPITIQSITFDQSERGQPFRPQLLFGGKCGDFVAVRPCAEEFEGKTFLGILLGELALSQSVRFNPESGDLRVERALHNPMIFIPERGAVVFGCGSWWGRIKDEAHLRKITDDDIENVWYVRALKWLEQGASSRPESDV